MSVLCMSETLQSEKGYEIPMIITRPMDLKKHPCVILLHGTCSDKNEVGNAYVYLANQLANAGYVTIRFDFIGSGQSKVDYLHYTYKSAVDDTHTVLSYAKKQGYGPITLLGWSQGAAIALLSANDDVSSVITLSAAVDMSIFVKEEDVLEAQKKGYVWYDPGFSKPVKLSREWFEDVLNTNVLELYSHKHLPTLCFHGLKDSVVSCLYSKKCVEASAHSLSKVIYLDECDHVFCVLTHGYEYFGVVVDQMIEWLNEINKKAEIYSA